MLYFLQGKFSFDFEMKLTEKNFWVNDRHNLETRRALNWSKNVDAMSRSFCPYMAG